MSKNLYFLKIAILTIILLFASGLVFGQKSNDPAYKIRASKDGVTVTFKRKTHRLNLRQEIDAAKVTETELIFASEKDGFRYLVIDVSGWSREKQNDRQCGAGIESNIIWLKLDAAWEILDSKSVRYESCWSSAEIDEPFKVTKNSLRFSFYDIGAGKEMKLSYNSDEAEKGFQIEEKAMNK